MEKVKILSPAKINIGLWITGKRPDGYHEIFTLFHTIDLNDYIHIEPYHKLSVSSTSPKVPENKENIVYKALKKFEEWTGIQTNYRILIEKNIPVGAGLGGGSSNAAAVLKKINELEGNPLSEEELMKLGSTLGADIPFFIKGGFAKAEGIGDKLIFLEKRFKNELFIIYPNIEVSTKEIYSMVTENILTKKEEIPIIDGLLEDLDNLIDNIENTLGELAQEKYPVVKEVMNTLKYLGYRPNISGSGSSVYAFGSPTEEIERICKVKNWKLIKTALK